MWGRLIAFRIGYTDAEVMAKEFGKTIPATALADLERYEAVVKLLVDGANQEPFRAKMLPPLGKPHWPEGQAHRPVARAVCHAARRH